MIIKDVEGGTLELTKNKLIEKDKLEYGGNAFYTTFGCIRAAEKRFRKNPDYHYHKVLCTSCRDKKHRPSLSYRVDGEPRIGCRVFSPQVFAKILKAAGVKPARKKAKKAVR